MTEGMIWAGMMGVIFVTIFITSYYAMKQEAEHNHELRMKELDQKEKEDAI